MGVMQLMPGTAAMYKAPDPLVQPTRSMAERKCSQTYGSAIEVIAVESPPRTTQVRGVSPAEGHLRGSPIGDPTLHQKGFEGRSEVKRRSLNPLDFFFAAV